MVKFNVQINRLRDVYGDRAFPDERIKLLWREVKDHSDRWFEQTVDKLIGECPHAPLLPKFREEISLERQRLWEAKKLENSQDSKDFWAGTYHPDDVKTICQMIKKRVHRDKAGNSLVADEDYSKFIEHLKGAVKK